MRNLLWHSLLVIVALAVVLTPVGMLLAEPMLKRMGADAEVTADAVLYTRIVYGSMLFSLLPMVINSLFRGEGDTIFPFKLMALALGLNVVLDPLFIFGFGPVPRMGVAGAAVTTASSFLFATLLVLRELRNPNRKVRFDRSAWRWDPSLLRGLAAVSAPAFVATCRCPCPPT